jgi:phosphoribosylanthranilate isomerase
MRIEAKICGINSAAAMAAALAGGARYVGLVFYPPSPRSLSPDEAAALVVDLPRGVTVVGLFVDATDAEIEAVTARVALGLVQLHGCETPARVAAVAELSGLPVMKAIRIGDAADIAAAAPYLAVVERLLFDARPPPGMKDALPGGNAVSFDWSLLAGWRAPCPWMLSGGLDAANVAEAVRISGAPAVDVSSGVESAPGQKDPARIRAFLAALARLG